MIRNDAELDKRIDRLNELMKDADCESNPEFEKLTQDIYAYECQTNVLEREYDIIHSWDIVVLYYNETVLIRVSLHQTDNKLKFFSEIIGLNGKGYKNTLTAEKERAIADIAENKVQNTFLCGAFGL